MKKRFYIYSSWKEMFELLSDQERSTMLMNLFNHQEGMEPVLDTTGLKMAWASMKFLLDKDGAAYEKAVQRGKAAAQAKQLSAPIKQEPVPALNNRDRVDNVNDNDNDKVDDKVGRTEVTLGDTLVPTTSIDTELTESERKAVEFDKMFASV